MICSMVLGFVMYFVQIANAPHPIIAMTPRFIFALLIAATPEGCFSDVPPDECYTT